MGTTEPRTSLRFRSWLGRVHGTYLGNVELLSRCDDYG